MSESFYVVREDTRQLLDILPNYKSGDYTRNVIMREAYSKFFNCSMGNVSIIRDKNRVKHYKGIV